VVDSTSGKVLGTPVISGRGFSDDPVAFEPVLQLVITELERVTGEGVVDSHRLAQTVRRVAGRWVSDRYRRRPMIIPTIVEV
jgi:ribonuclease J